MLATTRNVTVSYNRLTTAVYVRVSRLTFVHLYLYKPTNQDYRQLNPWEANSDW